MNRRNFVKNLGLGVAAVSMKNITPLSKDQEHIVKMAENIYDAFNKRCFIEVVDIWNTACDKLPIKDIQTLHSFPEVGLMVINSVKNLEKDGLISVDEGISYES